MKLCRLFACLGSVVILATSLSFLISPISARAGNCPSTSVDSSGYSPIYGVVCEFKDPGSHLNGVFHDYSNPTFQQVFIKKLTAGPSYPAIIPNDIQTCDELGGQAILRQNEINVKYQQLIVDYGQLIYAIKIAKDNPNGGSTSGVQSSLVEYDSVSKTYKFKGDRGAILEDMNVKKDAIDIDVLELFKISTIMDSPIQGTRLSNCYPSALTTQVNPYWDAKTGLNADVLGPLNVFLSHLGGFNSDYGYYYQKPANLSDFFNSTLTSEPDSDPKKLIWVDYANLQEFSRDYATMYNISQFTKNETFDQVIKSGLIQSLTVAGVAVQDGGTGTKNRCGAANTASIGINIDILYYSGCVITDFFSNFTDAALISAGQLLAYTAGVPQATVPRQYTSPENHFEDNGPPASFWGDYLPSDVKVPFQTLMVDRGSDVGQTIYTTQGVISKLLDVLVVMIFLVVAIMNILQIQTNTFGIRKLIPGLIIGFIAAQASFFIIRGALEVVGIASNGIISLAAPAPADGSVNPIRTNIFQNYVDNFARVRGPNGSSCFTTSSSKNGDCSTGGGSTKIDNGKVFQQFVLNFFVLVAAIFLFVLGFLFGARVFIFTIAVPLAPIAVISRFFPPLSFIWTRWFKTVSAWIIMPLPAMGLLLVSSLFFSVGNKLPTNNLFGYLLNYTAGIIFLYGAIKIPFTFAGEAKGFVEKYNALGRGIGIRATPYGAFLRGKSKSAALASKSEKQLLEGDVFKSSIARKFGGDTINRAYSRADKTLDKASEDQKGLSAKVDAEAEKQLQVGMGRTAAQSIAARKGLEGLGKALENFVDTGERLQKKTGIAALRKGSSYSEATEAIAQRKLDTDQISGQATFESERRFILGGDMGVADHRYTDLVSKLKKTGSLEGDEWLELKGLGKKNGADIGLMDAATNTGLTQAQRDANRDIFLLDSHTQKINKQRAAVDRVAFTRREKIAETAGLKGAQENLRSEAENQFARERVSENGKYSVIKSIVNSDTSLRDVVKRTKAFDVMLAQSKKDDRLKKVMDANSIMSQADLDSGVTSNKAKINAIKQHFADLQVENVATSMAEDGTNKGLEKKVAADISTKQNDWKLGYAVSNISKIFPAGGVPAGGQEVLYEKLLSSNTSTLDPEKFTATDVGTAERNLGALFNGLQSEEFRADNANAIKNILDVGGIGLFNITDGMDQLNDFINVTTGSAALTTGFTKSGNLRNDITLAKQRLTESKLGKRLNQITSAPDKNLAN